MLKVPKINLIQVIFFLTYMFPIHCLLHAFSSTLVSCSCSLAAAVLPACLSYCLCVLLLFCCCVVWCCLLATCGACAIRYAIFVMFIVVVCKQWVWKKCLDVYFSLLPFDPKRVCLSPIIYSQFLAWLCEHQKIK